MDRPAYYAEGKSVWKNSVERKNPDGSTTYTLGFEVCRMAAPVDKQAHIVAAILSLHGPMLAYIRRCASNCAEANELLKRAEGSA